MSRRLTPEEVRALLDRLRAAMPIPECRTCECLQGFVTQIRLDADPAGAPLTAPLTVPSAEMHPCLGCDPCPPAAMFADYLRRR